MNFLTKIKYSRLLRLYSPYSTSAVEQKIPKTEIIVEKSKPTRPFAKDILLNRFNLNMLEFPELENNEILNQTLKVSKEVDKLMNMRDKLDRKSILSRLSASGIMGVTLPGIFIDDRYNWMMLARFIESIGVDVDYALCKYFPQTLVGQSILRGGSDDQKKQYLNSLARGELIGSLALTEQLSDTVEEASLRTTATEDVQNDSWIINGRKTRVFNYHDSDIVVVFARTPSGEIAGFVVDSKSEGISADGGQYATKKSSVDLTFTDVKVPKGNILSSQLGIQLPRFLSTVNNIAVSTLCALYTKLFLRHINDFVCDRTIFGKPLSQFETIQEHIVDLTSDSYSAETLAYFVAGLLDNDGDGDFLVESSLAKIYGMEAVRRCRDVAMKIIGANYLSDQRLMSLHADADILIGSQAATKLSRCVATKELMEYMLEGMRKDDRSVSMRMEMLLMPYKIEGYFDDRWYVKSLKYALHPRVGLLADAIYKEYYALSKILRKLAKTPQLLEEEFCLEKVSSVLVDSLALMAVLGRASRSIAIGLRNDDHEVRLVEMTCKSIGRRIKGNVALLGQYPGNVGQWKGVVDELGRDIEQCNMAKSKDR